ncbi:MAG: DUF4189 domain-containing protein [Xanthomonadaceae bacterium]|nr:DUF4189 domain-containing protein [Xanthomonadaceae bacterium]
MSLNSVFTVIVFWMALTLVSPAKAQHIGRNPGPCPGGSAPVNGSCGSPSNASSGRGSLPEIWRNRYGAIAMSVGGSDAGVANGQKSMRAARKLAVKKCAASTCRVATEYVNGCGSIVNGRKDGSWIRLSRFGVNQSESEAKAMADCAGYGGTNCAVELTGCSLPVRVQ